MTTPEKTELHSALETAIVQLESAMQGKDLHGIVSSVLDSLRAARLTNHSIFEQLASLSSYIENAKKEIASIRADAIGGDYIPSATDHLDEVVGATEEATNKIMDCCDGISTIAGTLPAEQQNALTEQVTKIYEACNFQDITGQRITKVVRTLKHIEGQVTGLLKALDDAGFSIDFSAGPDSALQLSKATDTEKHLLNGPQAQSDAIKQDDIDKLFG